MQNTKAIDNSGYIIFLESKFLLLFALTLITVIISFFIQRHWFNSDVGIIIHETNALLAGGNYVTSFFETNPPMILYLTVPICFIAELFSLNPLNIAYCYFSIMALISVLTSYALLTRLVREPLICYMTYAGLLFITFLLPMNEFGEREHITMMLITPYLFASSLALANKPLSQRAAFLIGLAAGVGFALKPYFLIPLCLIETLFIAKKQRVLGWVRTETVTIIGVMVTYLLAIWCFHPAYIHIILPLVSRYYFSSITNSWQSIYSDKLYNFCVVTLIATFFFYKNNRYKSIIILISLSQIGFMAAFLATKTNWFYHMLPAIGLSILQITFCLATVISRWIEERRISFTPELIAVMSIYFIYLLFVLSGKYGLSEIMLLTIKWLCILSLTVFATLMIHFNNKMFMIALPFLAVVFYLIVPQTFFYEIEFFSHDSYFFLIIDFILAWITVNILICVFSAINLTLHCIPALQRLLCFILFLGIVYFYPLHKLYLKYHYEYFKIVLQHEFINYFKQFPNRGGIFCFGTNDPGVCIPLSFYTRHDLVSRQPTFWWLRGLVKAPLTTQLAKDKEYLLNISGEDLKKHHPQWVIIDPDNYKSFVHKLNIIDFLSFDKNFRDEWQHYKLKKTIPNLYLPDLLVYERITS